LLANLVRQYSLGLISATPQLSSNGRFPAPIDAETVVLAALERWSATIDRSGVAVPDTP